MTDTQHTPAPWIANNKRNSGGNIIIKGFGGADVAAVFTPAWGYDAPRDEAETKANARLIAFAPDLYSALQNLLQAVQNPLGNLEDAMEEAQNAISKAEGRA